LLYGADCSKCRHDHWEDDRDPPCDRDGKCNLDMPELTEVDHLAMSIWNKIQIVGPDLAFRLSDATMDQEDMDGLLDRLQVISKAVDDANKQKGKD